MARTGARKTAKRAPGASRRRAATTRRRTGVRPQPSATPATPTRGGAIAPRSRSLPAGGVVDVDATLESVAAARAALVEVQAKLNAISDAALDKLPRKDQEAWADELAQTDNAIAKLDTAALKVINADFAGRVPELEQKTKALAASLQKMKDVADVIAAVGKVIQIVTEIAALIK